MTGKERRIDSLRRLIDALRTGEMMVSAAAGLLGVSTRAARRHFEVLEAANVVSLARRLPAAVPGAVGAPVFALAAEEQVIESFMAKVAAPEPQPQKLPSDPRRHFHVLRHDASYAIRVRSEPVAPDPWALPPAFFSSRAMEARA
jgi:hypothetical protein